MRLLDKLKHHAKTQPDELAICEVDPEGLITRAITYAQYARAVAIAASALNQDTPAGATILVQLPNQLAYPVVYLAALAAGRTVFPLHPALTGHEIAEAGAKSQAGWMIADRKPPAGIEPIPLDRVETWLQDTAGDAGESSTHQATGDGAMLLQSSGTTGLPKIVRRSAASIDAVAENVALAVRLLPKDNVIAAVPLCHSYGIENGVVGPLWAGATVYACPGFDPQMLSKLWTDLDRLVMPIVPIMVDLLALADSLPLPGDRLKSVYSAGARLPSAVSERFHQRFGRRVGHLYGATEIGSVTFGPADAQPPAGWVGRPMTGVSIRVLDLKDPSAAPALHVGAEGQIAVRAPSMLDRYLDNAELPVVDGHYLTGDLGTLDADGGLTLTGRLKALIDIGGMKVNAMEVERALAEHPAVAEAAVVPVAITQTLSRLTAFIIAADPGNPPSSAELRAHTRAKLAAYKVPRAFKLVGAFPRTSLGKVKRRALMEAGV